VAAPGAARAQPAAATDPQLARASVNGKYQRLLRQIAAPGDLEFYGEFNEWGFWSGTAYAGHTDLPPGHWVYLHPSWYIWRDAAGAGAPSGPDRRSWGPEQATGAPDTREAGDLATAWASATPDGQEEWLLLEYAEAVVPAAVLVHETFNPGAVYRVTFFDAAGQEVEAWRRTDPTPREAGMGLSVIPAAANVATKRVKIYLSSPGVPGWNEIDAVGLLDRFGNVQWAVRAQASSTYAEREAPVVMPDPIEEAIRWLEAAVRALREAWEAARAAQVR
jgi:hypothetical protein